MNELMNLIKKLFTDGQAALLGFVSGIAVLYMPAIPIVITVLLFIVTDAIFGYKVSRRCGKPHIESHKIWKTVNKFLEAFSVITLGLLIDKYITMTYEELTAVKVVAGAICLGEGISLLESFRALHPHAILSRILAKVIKSKAEKYLDVDLSDIISLENTKDDTKNTK